jgi:hypothetical protein
MREITTMNLISRSIGTGLILLAAAGCAGEGPSQSAPENGPLASPANPPSLSSGGASGNMSGQMQPPGSTSAVAAKGTPAAGSGPKIEGPSVEGDKAGAATGALPAANLAAIKELPADEQEAAIKQVSCPVSGEPLGSMGKPLKVSAEGRSFYLCCKGCEKEVKADPKSVLAKLDQKRP